MKPLYCDSSVLVSLLFEEEGSSSFFKQLRNATEKITSTLTEAEVLSALAREGHPVDAADTMLSSFSFFVPDSSLKAEYSEIFKIGYCKGADAYHLACALSIAPDKGSLTFLSADKKQLAIARKLGFSV